MAWQSHLFNLRIDQLLQLLVLISLELIFLSVNMRCLWMWRIQDRLETRFECSNANDVLYKL